MSGCAEPSSSPEFRCEKAAIRGGTGDAEWLATDPRQALAVCAVELEGSGESALGVCSGVLLDATHVLTAAHCIDEVTPRSVVFGADITQATARRDVLDATAHPEFDLALLRLAGETDGAFEVLPVPALLVAPPAKGSIVQIGGFGVDTRGELGKLAFAASEVVENDATSFTVALERRAAACVGDSGGPALLRDANGVVRVAGILSSGSAACASTDRYTRIDIVSDWLAENGIATTTGVFADCGLVGEGRCFDSTALWCDDDTPNTERCSADEVCGYSTDAEGFRCIPEEADACNGIGDRGACDDDELTRCLRGELVTSPCDVCDAVCGTSAESGRATCIAQ